MPAGLAARAVVGEPLEMFPVEFVARISDGLGYADYWRTGLVCCISLPPGLEDGDHLTEPIFTPARSTGVAGHDAPPPTHTCWYDDR